MLPGIQLGPAMASGSISLYDIYYLRKDNEPELSRFPIGNGLLKRRQSHRMRPVTNAEAEETEVFQRAQEE